MKLNNLTDLAKFLKKFNNKNKKRKMGFDMNHPYSGREDADHPCGSACCIGGWVQHHNKETRNMDLEDAVLTISPQGTSWYEVEKLCYPNGGTINAWGATPQQAARAVEILRDTGKCDWDRAMEEA